MYICKQIAEKYTYAYLMMDDVTVTKSDSQTSKKQKHFAKNID